MELKEIERSIIKKYRKPIWKKFVQAIKDFDLIKENDHIAVCISGGKDSFLLAKCLEELQKHGQYHYQLSFICMDPGYSDEHITKIKDNALKLGIPLQIFRTDVFEVSTKLNPTHPCYMCARMRRGYLYDYAKKLGCNKIALGHHFDDVIETILMSMLYSGETKGMLPKLKSTNFSGMELIRPLYYVKESDILAFAKYNELEFLNCACQFTKGESYENSSKRKEIKELIKTLSLSNPFVQKNIYQSICNINLQTVISYIDEDGCSHHFLDDFDK